MSSATTPRPHAISFRIDHYYYLMRRMAFSLTTPQILAQSKTVTRRVGWRFLQPGDLVMAV